MSNNSTLTPVGESLRSFFSSFMRLARFDKDGMEDQRPEEYYPSADLILKLGDTCRGWDVSAFQLFKRNEYFGEIWTDRKTLRQVVVAFRSNRKGMWPVAFEVLDDNVTFSGIFSGISRGLLAKRSKAALRSIGRSNDSGDALPIEGRKRVA